MGLAAVGGGAARPHRPRPHPAVDELALVVYLRPAAREGARAGARGTHAGADVFQLPSKG
ncbi:hypothetical protein LCGC14_2838740, partial [marine sediment metagenome]